MKTYYDIEIRKKSGPWQKARLYADFILFAENKISREDILYFRYSPVNFSFRIVTKTGETFFVRGHKALFSWYDEIRPLRLTLALGFFVLSLAFGFYKPGFALWPVVLFYAFFSALIGYFFHWALEKGIKTFSISLASYFLIVGFPLSMGFPPLLRFFFVGGFILVFLFFLWKKSFTKKRIHTFFPILVWSFVTLLNHHYLIFFGKKFLDYQYQKAFGKSQIVCNSERCLLGEQIWEIPAGMQVEENNFLKSWLYDDITFFFGFINKKYLIKIPPEGRYGFFSEAPYYYTGQNFFSFAEEYLKKNQNFFWALYLSSSPRYSQNEIMWKTFAFFNPAKRKVEEILLAYIPGDKNSGWIFCLPLPEGGNVEYLLSRILEGFLKQKNFP